MLVKGGTGEFREIVNTLKPTQNGQQFTDNIFKAFSRMNFDLKTFSETMIA